MCRHDVLREGQPVEYPDCVNVDEVCDECGPARARDELQPGRLEEP